MILRSTREHEPATLIDQFLLIYVIDIKTRIWISQLFYAFKTCMYFMLMVFEKPYFKFPEFRIRIKNPDQKIRFFPGFSRFFLSVVLSERRPPYLQSNNYWSKSISIFWRLHAIVHFSSAYLISITINM